MAIAYAIVDHVVDSYEPVVAGLENDIDEIEDEVFGGSATVSRRMTLGYPFALALMVLVSVGLYAAFKRRRWI
jgi:Mg2+ and Co2+ transporter CorA